MENDNSHAPRLILFVLLSSLVLFGFPAIMQKLAPKPPVAAQKPDNNPAAGEPPAQKKDVDAEAPAAPAGKAPQKTDPAAPADPAADAKPAPTVNEQWTTLGSADPKTGHRMLVTLTNRGAAVERIELNHPRYSDITHRETQPREDFSGWIGHIAPVTSDKPTGVRVQVVGRDTPLDQAGVKPGDVITAVNGEALADALHYQQKLYQSRPGKPLELTLNRDGQEKQVTVTPVVRPVRIVQAENSDPLSFLLTLDALDDRKIDEGRGELKGLTLRTGNWQMATAENEVTFTWPLTAEGLEIVKRYRLTPTPAEQLENLDHASFHLEMSVELRNTGKTPLALAYRLDGPTGLPIEGSWYAQKISRNYWDASGMRDVVGGFRVGVQGAYHDHRLVSCDTVVKEGETSVPGDAPASPMIYAGVDALYFASAILPTTEKNDEVRFTKTTAIRVGEIPKDPADKRLTNVSCRLTSQPLSIEPGQSITHDFRLFAGPKRPALLAKYGMDELVYYGWFWWTARPLLWLMHMFHDYVVFNYGLAIIMLTVTVRSCMFPISRKQALNAAKMQELQPELKKITEKYKGDMEKRARAQQELFAKHNYHPLAGCLPVFLQLPIFIGLYRSLALDIELRHAPLIPGVKWCGNLCAPDMLWYWEPKLMAYLSGPHGWLGPYMNVLPLATVGLFLYQQKKMMPAPDPNDEQAVMQHKVMTYMMIFMGLMFFKVASGLCIYFIASSVWSLAERKLLPKPAPKSGEGTVIDVTATSTNGSERKKNRERR